MGKTQITEIWVVGANQHQSQTQNEFQIFSGFVSTDKFADDKMKTFVWETRVHFFKLLKYAKKQEKQKKTLKT